jgi:hypothetical protein
MLRTENRAARLLTGLGPLALDVMREDTLPCALVCICGAPSARPVRTRGDRHPCAHSGRLRLYPMQLPVTVAAHERHA